MTAVATLAGADLALWVALSNKNYVDAGDGVFDAENETYVGHIGGSIQAFAPHEDWSQGGPLIEKLHNIRIQQNAGGFAVQCFMDPAMALPIYGYGPTILIAAMRALVASVYGDTVPDEVNP